MTNNSAKYPILETDLYTYLYDLARRLRIADLALSGFAHRQGDPAGDPDLKALISLGGSLDTVADALEASAKALCQKCRLVEVTKKLQLSPMRMDQKTPRTPVRRRYRTPRPGPKASDRERISWTSLRWPSTEATIPMPPATG